MESTPFKSNTIFFAPLWTDDYEHFISVIKKDLRYRTLPKDEIPQYLLPYITRIYCNDSLFSEFELASEHFPDLCMFDSRFPAGGEAKVQSIRLSCFSTGCVFMEFQVVYQGLSLDDIADFSFRFKNANSTDKSASEKIKMKDAIAALLPANSGCCAFYASSDIKNECKMFHQILLDEVPAQETLEKHLVHLRRGYHKEFPIPVIGEDFDMLFEPYKYDHWAGSQEGLVNIFHLTESTSTNSFLTKYKPKHLAVDYRFLYLVLLNQRFSAIVYLGKIPFIRSYTRKHREKMNMLTSSLKTLFSFSIVSDDQLFQTIYAKMYSIMGIDRLLADIRDNEEQIELLQNHEMLNAEKKTSVFLFGLSILSLFSVLVDAAGYFDRFPLLASVSTALSALCLCVIIVAYLIWWLCYKRK